MRVVLTGASGQLGAYLVECLAARGHDVLPWSGVAPGHRSGMVLRLIDLTDETAVRSALDESDPDAVLHAAAVSSAEAARLDPAKAQAVNVEGTRRLVDWCLARGRRLLFTSTDLVFDGSKSWNREDDPAEPVLTYGRTKREAEPIVLGLPRGQVARVSLLFGPSRCGRETYFDRAVSSLRRGEPQAFFEDEYRTPLHFAVAAEALVRLLESDASGIVHVGGAERVSRFALMRRVASALGLDPGLVHANRQMGAPLPEPRPADVSLDTTRLASLLPDLRPRLSESWAVMAE